MALDSREIARLIFRFRVALIKMLTVSLVTPLSTICFSLRMVGGKLLVKSPFTAIDHVQLAMPPGEEQAARDFYSGVLGMKEIAKPPELAKRGGCWFESGTVNIHLGVENDFRPAKKAHPALRCSNYDALVAKLRSAGIAATQIVDIPGVSRCHVHDPFGNRLELIRS